MLYLSKIGPENISDHFLAPIIFKSMKLAGHCPSVIKLFGLHFVSIVSTLDKLNTPETEDLQ